MRYEELDQEEVTVLKNHHHARILRYCDEVKQGEINIETYEHFLDIVKQIEYSINAISELDNIIL